MLIRKNKYLIALLLSLIYFNTQAQPITMMEKLQDYLNNLSDFLIIASPFIFIALLFAIIVYANFSFSEEKPDKNTKEKVNTDKEININTKNEEKLLFTYFLKMIENEIFYEKTKTIFQDVEKLLLSEIIINDFEIAKNLQNIRDIYLPTIIKNFVNIDPSLRNKLLENNITAVDMTIEQIKLLDEHITTIKNHLLNEQIHKLKVNDLFLKNKFNHENHNIIQFLEVNK